MIERPDLLFSTTRTGHRHPICVTAQTIQLEKKSNKNNQLDIPIENVIRPLVCYDVDFVRRTMNYADCIIV